ncbi:MAG: hypothetical protein WBW33_24280, partial [Bryobacteraceae bacterium]
RPMSDALLAAARKSGQLVASIAVFANGSFTAPGLRQTAYFTNALVCSAWGPDYSGTYELAIFEGTRLILNVNQKVGMFGGHADAQVAVADVNNDGIDELLLEAVGGQPEIQGEASLVSFRGGEPHVMKEFNEVYFNGCLGIGFARVTASVITYTPKQSFVDQYEAPCTGEGAGGNVPALAEFKRVHVGEPLMLPGAIPSKNPASVLTQTNFVRACLLAGAILVLTTALHSQPGSVAEFRPKIPKVWVEAEVAGMELPLAAPAPRVTNISASYYYSISQVTIYKTYPFLSSEKPFPEYWNWLKQQEPEVAFGPPELKTKADWEKYGEYLFSGPPEYFARTKEALEAAAKGQDFAIVFPEGGAGTAEWVIRRKGKIEIFEPKPAGCGRCHWQDAARRGWTYPSTGGMRRAGFFTASQRRQAMLLWYGTPWFKPDPNVDVALTLDAVQPWSPDELNRTQAVVDLEGDSFRSPLQTPTLIGLKDRKYLDHTGLYLHRSIADLMRYIVLHSELGLLRKYGDFIPGGDNDHKDLPPPTKFQRFTDEQLYALALYVYSLDSPVNPNQPDAVSAKGETIFKREGCADCHTPPLYTNNKPIPVDGFAVPPEHKKKYDMLDARIGLDPYLATKTRRGTGYYKVPSLRGVWTRGALEHNGSVASLEDWFDPNRLKDSYVPTGFRGPNPTRAVKGHPFGLQLSAEDKKELIAFLRTL